ncbi:MAG: hypothetical protein ACR2G6_10905, partial [Gemmatimonadaceae bacterium]
MTDKPGKGLFFRRLALAALPPLAYVLVCGGLPLWSGELTPLREIAAAQSRGEIALFGRAYRGNQYGFKLVSTLERDAQIVVVGSSRVDQFRPRVASPCFYNASGAAHSMAELSAFFAHIGPERYPRAVVLALDQPWFNGDSDEMKTAASDVLQLDYESEVDLYRGLNVSRSFLIDLIRGKVELNRLLRRRERFREEPARGIGAILGGHGYRADGTYEYAGLLADSLGSERRRPLIAADVASGKGFFATGTNVSAPMLSALDGLLADLARHGVSVVGFTPPYAPTLYRYMMASGKHAYLTHLALALERTFRRHGFTFIDFSDASMLGATDEM